MRQYTKGIKFYLNLARLAWEVLLLYGVKGLLRAVHRYLVNCDPQGDSTRVKVANFFRKLRLKGYIKRLVTIAILSKNRLELIQPCLEAINKFPSNKYKTEVLIGDTGTTEAEVWQYYRQAARSYKNLKIVKFFSGYFSKNYNRLIEDQARGQYVVLLHNDTLVTAHWLDNLIDPLEDAQIGLVGAKLLYQDNTIQHAGIEFDQRGDGFHIYTGEPRDLPEANYPAVLPAVSFAGVAMRHEVFDRFQLDENLEKEAQDTDFCLRVAEAGFKVLYNPAAEIYHLECSSRDWRKGEMDRLRLRQIWAAKLKAIQAKARQRLPFDPEEFSNAITIIRDDGIGDLLMGVCAFRKLRKRYPKKQLILATYQRNIEMMAGFKIFDQFIAIPDGLKYSPLPIPRASQIYNFINLEFEFETFWGSTTEDNRINRHLVYSRDLGLEPDFELVPMPDYKEARQRLHRLLRDLKVDLGQRFVVLCLIASNPARSWWEPYYPQLLQAVQALGLTPLVLGTRDSKYFQGPGIINLVGKTRTVTEFIEAVKLGKYVISTDTSATHIAALSRIPFLAIYTGGVKPAGRLNFYTNYEVVEPPASLDCYPCWDMGCKDLSVRWKSDPCRLSVRPEEVIEKFNRLVARFPVD